MVIKYSPEELNTIGEIVLIRECISRLPEYQEEPQYHQVFVPDEASKKIVASAQSTTSPLPNSFSADNFLQDYAQFQQHLDQAIQFNRDTSWQQQQQQQPYHSQMSYQQSYRDQSEQLSYSVAELFREAQQHIRPQAQHGAIGTGHLRARRLSDVEAEILSQVRGRIDI